MATKEILRFPNNKLMVAADPVEVFDEKMTQLSADLQETAGVYNAEGLAANQVGVLYRVFVIRDNKEYVTCFNPSILGMSTELVDSLEGCLSFPGVNETIKRAESVHVSYQNEGGEEQNRWLSGVAAVAFQHELDHLNGVVFTDHMGKLQKHLAMKKLDKVNRRLNAQTKNVKKMLASVG